MIAMFDKDKNGTVNFEEFSQLWRYVTDWLNCFRSYDKDNSGNIDRSELKHALTTFGYRFSDQFYEILMRRFDRDGKGRFFHFGGRFSLFFPSVHLVFVVLRQFEGKHERGVFNIVLTNRISSRLDSFWWLYSIVCATANPDQCFPGTRRRHGRMDSHLLRAVSNSRHEHQCALVTTNRPITLSGPLRRHFAKCFPITHPNGIFEMKTLHYYITL